MLRTSLIKSAGWLPALLVFSLTGCGMTQGITDGTKSAFNAVFYKKIKMRICIDDLTSHGSLSRLCL